MEIGELVAAAFLQQQVDEKCPFKLDEEKGVTEDEDESIVDDDREAVHAEQANNGGTLGDNLTDALPGKANTINSIYPAPKRDKDPAHDAKRPKGGVMAHTHVPEAEDIPAGDYPYLVAAHHLIPGNASLKPSQIKNYMTRNSTVTTKKGKSYKLKYFIGYNVNGCHNGVWLPGNYAIRTAGAAWQATPVAGKSWSALDDHPWCLNYVAAVVKAAGCQFHDAHEKYSAAVEKLLNKIASVLMTHIENCDDCKKNDSGEISPPYLIKERLYNLSAYLKSNLGGSPHSWRRPWFASDRWRDEAFSGAKISKEFVEAFDAARRVDKPVV